MINDKFNMFFASGTKQYCEFLLTMNVKHILISFAYSEPWKMKPILKQNNIDLLLDSGAFTAWNLAQSKKAQGDPNWKRYLINIDEYADFIEKHKDIVWRAVNLDVIPGEQGKVPTPEQMIESAEQGWENYLYLKKKGYNTIHVYHQGEPLEYLTRMIDYGCDYIGVSPCNDYSDEKKMLWLDRAFRLIVNSSNPKIKTHGFGVTSKRLVDRYPWFSCDSSSYSLTAAMGSIMTPYGRIYVSDQNKEDPDHIDNKPQLVREHIEKYLNERVGYGLSSMTKTVEEQDIICENCNHTVIAPIKMQSYKPRNFANIRYFLDMEEKIQSNKEPQMDFDKQQILL